MPPIPPPEMIKMSMTGGAFRPPAVYRLYSALARSSDRPSTLRPSVTACSSPLVRTFRRSCSELRDLDVMSAGPIVNEISASFDMFWNSDWALPVAAVVEDRATEQDLPDFRKRLAEKLAATGYPYPIDEQLAELRERLVEIRDTFIWAPGKVFVEHPSRVDNNADNVIALALRQRASEVERELLIESPYFVLGDATIERVRRTHGARCQGACVDQFRCLS